MWGSPHSVNLVARNHQNPGVLKTSSAKRNVFSQIDDFGACVVFPPFGGQKPSKSKGAPLGGASRGAPGGPPGGGSRGPPGGGSRGPPGGFQGGFQKSQTQTGAFGMCPLCLQPQAYRSLNQLRRGGPGGTLGVQNRPSKQQKKATENVLPFLKVERSILKFLSLQPSRQAQSPLEDP